MTDTVTVLPFTLPQRPAATRVRQVDRAALLAPAGGRTMPMAGFEDGFVDIVDYIVRVTEQIWTDRALGRIYDIYDTSCTVYSPAGIARSVEQVMAATVATMAAFPEEEAHHLNIAWSGDDARGFYTSHLGWTRMVNRGASRWGPATGLTVGRRFAADCVSRHNRIHTEWLVSDEGAVVRALGLSVDAAAALVSAEPRAELYVTSPPSRLLGQAPPTPYVGSRDDYEGWARGVYHDLWTRRRLDLMPQFYGPEAAAHWPGNRVVEGPRRIGSLMIELMASLPNGVMEVEHVCWSEETDGVMLAVRWRLTGATRRGGLLGTALPEDRLVSVPGVSHHRFADGRIAEEWAVFDEVAAVAAALAN